MHSVVSIYIQYTVLYIYTVHIYTKYIYMNRYSLYIHQLRDAVIESQQPPHMLQNRGGKMYSILCNTLLVPEVSDGY